jgi:hypothetical protein
MERVAVALALLAVAVVAAAVVRRGSAPATPARTGGTVPEQLDRADFVRADAPWLVVAFSARTCLACAGTWEKVVQMESAQVAVQDVAFEERRNLHRRYGVEHVPLVLVVDGEGVVRGRFVGPPTAAELWSALAELRRDAGPGGAPP